MATAKGRFCHKRHQTLESRNDRFGIFQFSTEEGHQHPHCGWHSIGSVEFIPWQDSHLSYRWVSLAENVPTQVTETRRLIFPVQTYRQQYIWSSQPLVRRSSSSEVRNSPKAFTTGSNEASPAVSSERVHQWRCFNGSYENGCQAYPQQWHLFLHLYLLLPMSAQGVQSSLWP